MLLNAIPNIKKTVHPFPRTLLERLHLHQYFDQFDWKQDIIVASRNGGVFLAYFHQLIPEDMLKHVSCITEKLVSQVPVTHSFQKERGEGKFYSFGFHRFSCSDVIPYEHMFEQEYLEWTQLITPLLVLLRCLCQKNFPEMLSDHDKLDERNPFHPFTSGQINSDTLTDEHTDAKDQTGSLNVVITYGNYTGGQLILPEIPLSIPIQPRDILLFQGSSLKHYVSKIGNDEKRTSINFYINSCSSIQL